MHKQKSTNQEVAMSSENQARTMWCPMVRVEGVDSGGSWNRAKTELSNNKTASEYMCHCVASDCVMWRWINDQDGYCGLAGKP